MSNTVVYNSTINKKSQQYYRFGQYSKSISEIKKKPSNLQPYDNYLLAKCYLNSYKTDSAVYYYHKIIEDKSISERQLFISSLLSLSLLYLNEGKIEIAETFYVRALTGSSIQEKKSLRYYFAYCEAFILSYSDVENSFERFEESILLYDDEDPEIIDVYFYFIDLLIEEYRFDKAQKLLSEALNLLDNKFIGNHHKRVKILLEYAYFLHKKGNSLESINLLKQEVFPIITAQNSNWSDYLLAEYYRFLSWPTSFIGKYDEAIELNKLYLKVIKDYYEPNHYRFAQTYRVISSLYNKLNSFSLANEYLLKSIDIFYLQENVSSKHTALFLKALFEFRNFNYDLSSKYFDSLLLENENHIVNDFYRSKAYYYKAYIELNNNNRDLAAKHALTSIDILEDIYGESLFFTLSNYNVLIEALIKSKKDSQLQAVVEKVLKQSEKNHFLKNEDITELLNNVARHLILKKEYDSCLNFIDRRIFNNDNLNTDANSYFFWTIFLKGEVFEKKYILNNNDQDLEDSFKNYYLCYKSLQNDNNKYSKEQDRIKQWFNWVRVESKLIDLSYSMQLKFDNENYLDLMLYFIESFKSSSLQETLNRNLAFQQTNIPDSLTLQVNSLKQQASFLTTQINKLKNKEKLTESDSSRLSDFKSVLLDNKVAFNDLMLYLENTFPRYYEINYNPKIATIEVVQERLADDEALIEYFAGKEYIYAYSISKDTATVHRLQKVSDSTISQFRDVVISGGFGQNRSVAYRRFVEQSHLLHEQLLKEPLSVIEKGHTTINKLYIIPDKSLNYIAFDLLLTKKVEEDRFVGYGKLPYLINDYNISYGYSASILFREDSVKQETPFNGKVLAFAPSYEKLLTDSSKLNELGQFRSSLSPLRYNKSEVDGISGYFDTRVFKAGEATEKKFVESFRGNDIIHLAMHGLVDSKDSEKSRLVFTPVEDSIHDNYLHNFELYNLNIDAKLAVLSACNTGYGKLEGGEGVMSLARAFTYAGTESVVMSQWPADDEASSVIMQSFYKYLSDGKRKDDALRLAKLDYLAQADPTKRNPFYWSNFVVMGDVSPLVKDNTRLYIYISIFMISLLLMAVFGIRYFAKRRAAIN